MADNLTLQPLPAGKRLSRDQQGTQMLIGSLKFIERLHRDSQWSPEGLVRLTPVAAAWDRSRGIVLKLFFHA